MLEVIKEYKRLKKHYGWFPTIGWAFYNVRYYTNRKGSDADYRIPPLTIWQLITGRREKDE